MQRTQTDGRVAKLRFTRSGGWSQPFPDLDSESTLVVVFAGAGHMDDPVALRQLAAAYRSSIVVGCSTAGEIFGQRVDDDSLSVGIIKFAHTRVAVAFAPVRGPDDSFSAGELVATQLEGPRLRAALVFSDGLNVNGSALVRGLNSVLSTGCIASGGLAGDGERFKRTWVLKHGEPVQSVVAAVGLYGDRVQVSHGSRGGWDVFGPSRRVTKSSGNVLFELDGAPALPLYKQYLGERAAGLPATALLFPLELKSSLTDQEPLVRTVLAVNEADGSMTFAGDLPEGSFVRLMHANFDRLVTAAGESASSAARATDREHPGLTVAISCVGRRLILGERTEEELEAVAEALPHADQLVGFYSYGEVSPLASGCCDLHNQTMTVTTIREI
jgi:hypothetical protein